MVRWLANTFCTSGDCVVITGAIVSGRVAVAVTGADELLGTLVGVLDESVESAAEDPVNETEAAPDTDALEEVDAALLAWPPSKTISWLNTIPPL